MQNYQPPTEFLLGAMVGSLDSQSVQTTQEAIELLKPSLCHMKIFLKFEEANSTH